MISHHCLLLGEEHNACGIIVRPSQILIILREKYAGPQSSNARRTVKIGRNVEQ